MESKQEELNTLQEDLDFALSELNSGYLDPGEEYELKRQIRNLEKKIRTLKENS